MTYLQLSHSCTPYRSYESSYEVNDCSVARQLQAAYLLVQSKLL